MNSFEPGVPARLVCSVPSEPRSPGNYIETQLPDEESRRCFCFRSSRDSPRRVVISVTQRNFGRRVALPSWPETRLFCFAFAPGGSPFPRTPDLFIIPQPAFPYFRQLCPPNLPPDRSRPSCSRRHPAARLPGRMIIVAATEILSFLATGDGPGESQQDGTRRNSRGAR